jgi:hypothetical protein
MILFWNVVFLLFILDCNIMAKQISSNWDYCEPNKTYLVRFGKDFGYDFSASILRVGGHLQIDVPFYDSFEVGRGMQL